jgi:tellurite resistance-related uncharacterized protein
MNPKIKLMAVSNVFCRMMNFENKGDVEEGHKHNYDHGTLVSSGSVLYEALDDDGNVVSSKVFNAPNMVYIAKETFHRITALEDKTVCACIHASRTIDNEIVDPDCLIEAKEGWDVLDEIEIKTGKEWQKPVNESAIRN